MTKIQLEAVIDTLVEIVDSWNDAAEDDDRGRANDAICLTLWDDGSGSIGRRTAPENKDVEDWHEFNNLDELVKVLVEGEGVVIEAEDLVPGLIVAVEREARRLAVADQLEQCAEMADRLAASIRARK